MEKKDAQEAAPILQRSLDELVTVVPATGRAGSDLRLACGQLWAQAEALLQADAAGPPLANCFDLAVENGATQAQLAVVRNKTLAEAPALLGAVLTKNSIVRMCLAYESEVIVSIQFTSRDDVTALQAEMNDVFAGVEETAADDMDQASFAALVATHAALNGYLTNAARPLPQMLRYAFAKVMPTLVMAYRLYADAGRADELRAENKVVHPAFMRPTGRAMSA